MEDTPPTHETEDPTPASVADRLVSALERRERSEAVAAISALQSVGSDQRKAGIRAVRTLTADDPHAIGLVTEELTMFLTDDDRAVRLTTAKLFVTLAAEAPNAALDAIGPLSARLADEDEFYYVRARSAEAIGYVASAFPDEAATPEVLADLRIGLSFDEPEVKQKLTKALSHIALGNPGRLRHHVGVLAEHLGDDDELLRYHLCTALVAIACVYPDAIEPAVDSLAARSTDENPYVRGRAAEAIGLWVRETANASVPEFDTASASDVDDADAAAFLKTRLRFARGEPPESASAIGDLDRIRDQTDAIAEAINRLGSDECPNCGMTIPSGGPPMCPRCGAPY